VSAGAGAANIVFVNRFFYPDQSATSQLLTDLSQALARSGFTVHVICSRQRYDDPGVRLPPQESSDGVTVHRIWTTRFGRDRLLGRALDYASFYGSSAVAMLRLLRRGDTVIAKTDPPLISIVAMAAAKIKGAHLVNWLQDIFPEVASLLGANPLPRPLDALLRRCRDLSLRSAHVNVVLGERMRERLLGLGVPENRIQIIENWAECGNDAPKEASHSILRAKNALMDKFVVGYSGNLGRAHEFQTLLRAAAILQDDREIVFLMTGGGAGMLKLSKVTTARGLNNFLFLPYQPRNTLCDSLAASDVHWVSLLPELEGLIVPSKFYGILAAARPTVFIGDPDGELARAIRTGQCGVTVAVGDVDALVGAVRHLKNDPAHRKRLGGNAYQRYCERYSAARAFDRWAEIVRSANRASDVRVQ
jgi:colanic acid biosynthesis glycosyl transferase WcaI